MVKKPELGQFYMGDDDARVYPIPSVVLPLEWQIEESSAPSVNIKEGVMRVPLSTSKTDLISRLHEMAHVKISPISPENLKANKDVKALLLPFEDYRVNMTIQDKDLTEALKGSRGNLLVRKPIREFQHGGIPEEIRRDAFFNTLAMTLTVMHNPRISPVEKSLALISVGPVMYRLLEEGNSYEHQLERWKENPTRVDHPGVFTEWLDAETGMENTTRRTGISGHEVYKLFEKLAKEVFPLTGIHKDFINLQRRCMTTIELSYTFDSVLRAAKYFMKEFKKLHARQVEIAGKMKEIDEQNKMNGIQDAQIEGLVKNGAMKLIEKNSTLRQRPNFSKMENVSLKDALEGIRFEVKILPLEIYKPSIFSRKRAPEYVGSVPKHMERLPFDGQVFERKLRGLGGTVLIDVSGSMSLTPRDIEVLVSNAPAVLVGCYSGDRMTNSGNLLIVAYQGRMADAQLIHTEKGGGYNIVDVQSLEWLGKQKPPRVWVSDGGVTGRNHDQYPAVVNKCLELCLQKSIIRVPTVELALKLFTDKSLFTSKGRLEIYRERRNTLEFQR